MTRQAGYNKTVTFTPGGGAQVTLALTRATGVEEVEELISTGSTDNGQQARDAGVFDMTGNMIGVLDNSKLPHLAAGGLVTAGRKGTLTFTDGGSTAWSIGIMVIRVNREWGTKGLYMWDFDWGYDSQTLTLTRGT